MKSSLRLLGADMIFLCDANKDFSKTFKKKVITLVYDLFPLQRQTHPAKRRRRSLWWNSRMQQLHAGFNVNMNGTHGSTLCIYLHAQREKRCVQRQSWETGAEVRKLKTAPLTPRHFTFEGLERQGDFPLSRWYVSSTDNNPLLKSKFGCRQNYIFQLNFFFCLILTVGVRLKPCLSGEAVIPYSSSSGTKVPQVNLI